MDEDFVTAERNSNARFRPPPPGHKKIDPSQISAAGT
jgi:hypothetical protein